MIKNAFKERGFELLDSYNTCDTKMRYICDNGHQSQISYSKLKKGKGCKQCSIDNMKLDFDYVKKVFSDENYILLESEYINNQTKMKYKCPKGHENITSYSIFNAGSRCPTCNNYKCETRCREIFEDIFGGFKFPKSRVNKRELDGYNEELKIAFEYNGIQHYEYIPFFHRKDPINLEKQKERDRLKEKMCKEEDIILFVIPYTIKYENLVEYIKNITSENFQKNFTPG